MGWGGLPGSDEANFYSAYGGMSNINPGPSHDWNKQIEGQDIGFKSYYASFPTSQARAAKIMPIREDSYDYTRKKDYFEGEHSAQFGNDDSYYNWEQMGGYWGTQDAKDAHGGGDGSQHFIYSPQGKYLASAHNMDKVASVGMDFADRYLGYSQSLVSSSNV